MRPARVALLGTGIIGSGMARNLAAAGLETVVWNRTRSKAEGLGAGVADSPAQAAEGAAVLITVLADGDTVEAAVRQAAPARGTIWVQSATVGVEACARLAALAEDLGLLYVDAPVLGTRGPAAAGELVVLASGPEDARAPLEPVLDAVSSKVLWLGEAGAGSRLKLVVNAWVLTIVEGVAESLALARALGLDPQLFLDAVRGGGLDAPYVQLKGAAMLAGDFDPQFPLWGAAKDARLVQEAGAAVGLELAVAAALCEHFERAVADGHGDKDMSATFLSH
ncbi:MAG: NAD(P)-dependent oxidoreductase [Marmoricola sp.]